MYRIAFTGPSGSGKTTLVNWVKNEFNLPHLNGSSGQIKTDEQNKALEGMGLTVGGGHRKVIQSGHAAPKAAVQNQWDILERRLELFNNSREFVTDRCTIDSWVYYLQQCSMYETTEQSEKFRDRCIYGLRFLTHIIYIPPMLFPVEDNNSRIANDWYQREMAGPVFWNVFRTFDVLSSRSSYQTKFHVLWSEDLEARKYSLKKFLSE